MIDLRTPIGWLFTLVGASLTMYGLTSDPAVYDVSLGINVNLWWGIVMTIFGLAMLAGVRLSSASSPRDGTSTDRS